MLDHIAMPVSDSRSSGLAKGHWEANHIHPCGLHRANPLKAAALAEAAR